MYGVEKRLVQGSSVSAHWYLVLSLFPVDVVSL